MQAVLQAAQVQLQQDQRKLSADQATLNKDTAQLNTDQALLGGSQATLATAQQNLADAKPPKPHLMPQWLSFRQPRTIRTSTASRSTIFSPLAQDIWTLPRPSKVRRRLTAGPSRYRPLRTLTLSFYRLPRQHHKYLKSTNMLERIMEEIKRRTLVVRIFPAASCLRLVRALTVEMHENWIEAIRYLKMEPLREQRKNLLRQIGEAA